ncbi:hypothetical protein [Dongia sp.]|uniref:hypothetical protein n=1 Tax=Dongia sp. TaxID=1977262 RepID=UPI0035B4F62E
MLHSANLPTVAVALFWFAGIGVAQAQPAKPVAIVEDVTPGVAAVAPLDLLRDGDSLTLDPDQGAIISYLDSCQRENIRGGTIVIGGTQSTVTGGSVSRQAVACDPLALALTPEQANQSAALAFRQPDQPASGDAVAAEAKFALATRHPIVIAPDLQEITIEDRHNPGHLRRIKIVDGIAALTDEANPLDKGGVYRLEGGGRSLTFRIGREATDAPLPILKRVIRF